MSNIFLRLTITVLLQDGPSARCACCSWNSKLTQIFLLADDEPNCGQANTKEINSAGMSSGAIAGISIGCIIIMAVVLAALLYWVRHLLVDLSCRFCPAMIAAISVNDCYYLWNLMDGFKSDTNKAQTFLLIHKKPLTGTVLERIC